MTAGFQYTADTINNDSAAAVAQVRDALSNLFMKYTWLNGLGSAGIQAAPTVGGKPAITSADAATILAALADLAGVYQFVNNLPVTLGFGASHVTGTVDLMSFGRQLTNGNLQGPCSVLPFPGGEEVRQPFPCGCLGSAGEAVCRLPHLVRDVVKLRRKVHSAAG